MRTRPGRIATAESTSSRGAAAIEFALILPLLVMLVFGIIEYGRAYNAKVTLTHASREAVRDYAINGNVGDAETIGVNAAPNLPGATVTVITQCTGVPGEVAEVEATWEFTYNIPLVKADTITLSETAAMRCGG